MAEPEEEHIELLRSIDGRLQQIASDMRILVVVVAGVALGLALVLVLVALGGS